ncbi:MAG: preprotein translocase subunit YajC [Betaproteobacteria bacterium]|nr:preprotein translocase subunit YajC [Betaproteobacteria bacterium]
MGKLILAVLVFVLAWWILRKYRKSMTREPPPQSGAAEDMVRCAYCGVHLPRSESHVSSGEFFCSEEHLRLRH